jgi:hypothetical protein
VIKQLKAKNTGLHSVRDIRKAIGADAFGLIMDGMTDAQVKSLVSKLDKKHPELKSSQNHRPSRKRRLRCGSGVTSDRGSLAR